MEERSVLHDGCFAPPPMHKWAWSDTAPSRVPWHALDSPVSCVEEFSEFYRVHYKYGQTPVDVTRERFLAMWREAERSVTSPP